jgi:16S rRNA (cytidine1402-2'-O)-methyltransferase
LHTEHPQKLEPALYVVATPIGNLRDITLRALDILAAVDVVAAEDTRNTANLLSHHTIRARQLISVHQHNERESASKLIKLIQGGQSVAFVSDAGTPAISDPGSLLVQAILAAGLRVIPIPGASAVIAALSASGFPEQRFLFYGFLPNKSAARCLALQSLQDYPYVLAFYEAPHRILDCITDLCLILGGERQITLAREITKLFETIHSCALRDAQAWLLSDSNQQRGEFVVLVSGAPQNQGLSPESERTLKCLLAELPLKQAVMLAAQISEGSRNELYDLALKIKDQVQ